MPIDTGAAPAGIDPPMVSDGSPGRCSGQSSGADPDGPVTERLVSARYAARGSMVIDVGTPSAAPGAIVITVRFSAILSAPNTAPVV